MAIVTLTKHDPSGSSATAPCGPVESRVAGAPDLVKIVARMASEWEVSDELPTEFAERVVNLFREQNVPNLGR